MARKPRSDSKLDAMPESRVLELRDRLMRSERYQDILDWLAIECGVSSSLASLSSFYKRHCAPLVAERRQFAAIRAEALGEAMKDAPVDWDEAIIERTKQLTFEFLDSDTVDADTVKKLLDAIAKARGQELDERKVRLMEEKAEFAELVKRAAANREGGVTAEEMAEIERKLKLM